MDSQFNSLLRSYSDNYVQFKVTGSDSYQKGYSAAQQGLDSIISQLQDTVSGQKQNIADFYKSGVEQNILDLEQRNRFLQRGIVSEKDEIVAAQMRSESPATGAVTIQTWQYVTVGILGITALALSAL
jgi:hypothetical protein